MSTNTDFSNKCKILGDLWLNYKEDFDFQDFIEYNDIGLPLAFVLSEGLAHPSDESYTYINETWELFLQSLGVADIGYDSLSQLLESSGESDN